MPMAIGGTTTAVRPRVTPARERRSRNVRASDGSAGSSAPALLRRDDQLHRSPGDRHPQTDAAGAVRLVRDRLRRHRLRIPARVCDRLPVRRPGDGPARHKRGFALALIDLVASRRWRAAAVAFFGPAAAAVLGLRRPHLLGVGRRVHRRRASCSASAKRGTFPPRSRPSPNGFRSASARWRPGSSTRHQHRRAGHAAVVPLITAACGWTWAFVATGAARIRLARRVAHDLRAARPHPRRQRGRARAHPQRSGRAATHDAVASADAASADVGLRRRQVSDRSDLVAVPLLASGFLHRNYGLDLRTIGPPLVAIYLVADVGSIGGGWLSSTLIKRGLERERGAQDRDARLRARGRADRRSRQA